MDLKQSRHQCQCQWQTYSQRQWMVRFLVLALLSLVLCAVCSAVEGKATAAGTLHTGASTSTAAAASSSSSSSASASNSASSSRSSNVNRASAHSSVDDGDSDVDSDMLDDIANDLEYVGIRNGNLNDVDDDDEDEAVQGKSGAKDAKNGNGRQHTEANSLNDLLPSMSDSSFSTSSSASSSPLSAPASLHILVVAFPIRGFLSPLIRMSVEACRRGHRITFITFDEANDLISNASLSLALGAASGRDLEKDRDRDKDWDKNIENSANANPNVVSGVNVGYGVGRFRFVSVGQAFSEKDREKEKDKEKEKERERDKDKDKDKDGKEKDKEREKEKEKSKEKHKDKWKDLAQDSYLFRGFLTMVNDLYAPLWPQMLRNLSSIMSADRPHVILADISMAPPALDVSILYRIPLVINSPSLAIKIDWLYDWLFSSKRISWQQTYSNRNLADIYAATMANAFHGRTTVAWTTASPMHATGSGSGTVGNSGAFVSSVSAPASWFDSMIAFLSPSLLALGLTPTVMDWADNYVRQSAVTLQQFHNSLLTQPHHDASNTQANANSRKRNATINGLSSSDDGAVSGDLLDNHQSVSDDLNVDTRIHSSSSATQSLVDSVSSTVSSPVLLVNSVCGFDECLVSVPNVHFVGGMIPNDKLSAPAWLTSWLDKSSKGVVLVLFGGGSQGSLELWQLKALWSGLSDAHHASRFRVLWAMKNEEKLQLGNLPSTFRIKANFPQLPAIAHPAVRMVISSCGGGTVHESLYYGKPLICIPLFYDQLELAARVALSGAGLSIDRHRLDALELSKSIQNIQRNSSFRSAAKRVGKMLRWQGGVSSAVQILESAAKHSFAHLQPYPPIHVRSEVNRHSQAWVCVDVCIVNTLAIMCAFMCVHLLIQCSSRFWRVLAANCHVLLKKVRRDVSHRKTFMHIAQQLIREFFVYIFKYDIAFLKMGPELSANTHTQNHAHADAHSQQTSSHTHSRAHTNAYSQQNNQQLYAQEDAQLDQQLYSQHQPQAQSRKQSHSHSHSHDASSGHGLAHGHAHNHLHSHSHSSGVHDGRAAARSPGLQQFRLTHAKAGDMSRSMAMSMSMHTSMTGQSYNNAEQHYHNGAADVDGELDIDADDENEGSGMSVGMDMDMGVGMDAPMTMDDDDDGEESVDYSMDGSHLAQTHAHSHDHEFSNDGHGDDHGFHESEQDLDGDVADRMYGGAEDTEAEAGPEADTEDDNYGTIQSQDVDSQSSSASYSHSHPSDFEH